MASPKYTSINVLEEQHVELKRIAEFRGIRITDLGVEMAGDYIKRFKEQHGNIMDELKELEKRMNELRSKISKTE